MSVRSIRWAWAAVGAALLAAACTPGASSTTDPCTVNNGGCDYHAVCQSDSSGVTCECAVGWEGAGKPAADGTPGCTPVDDCATNNGGCDKNAICTDIALRGVQCACKYGYSGDGMTCTPLNLCKAGPSPCDINATCTSVPGSFLCQCNPGWRGSGLKPAPLPDGGVDTTSPGCQLIDYCHGGMTHRDMNTDGGMGSGDGGMGFGDGGMGFGDGGMGFGDGGFGFGDGGMGFGDGGFGFGDGGMGFGDGGFGFGDGGMGFGGETPCGPNAVCTNVPGSYTCTCLHGYESDADGGLCTSIDFCGTYGNTPTDKCDPNATCTDTPGSYSCQCNSGFTGDGRSCTSIDFCGTSGSAPTDKCSANATCTDTPGSYTCQCNPGYIGDGMTCVSQFCEKHLDNCSKNATCTDTTDSFNCACDPGFTGDGVNCVQQKPCASGMAQCGPNSTCVDVAGVPPFYTCACNRGYRVDPTKMTCTAIDYCAQDNGGCDPNATCLSITGTGAACACKPGYTGDGTTCASIDFCGTSGSTPTDNCDSNATCTDTPGSFTCQCNAGYYGSGQTCFSGQDPCQTANGGCDPNATCSSATGAPVCTCNTGYFGDGSVCTQAQCPVNNGGCDANATCTDTNTGPGCQCNPGYQGDGKTCTSIDYCGTNGAPAPTDQCSPAAVCTDTPGSYTCACAPGWTGDGFTCTIVNPCLTNNGGCDPHAICTNTVGSFSCACPSGYVGNGQTCAKQNTCDPSASMSQCGANATCVPQQSGPAGLCVCNQGWTGDGLICTSIDYCGMNEYQCDPNATCMDTPGSYACTCNAPHWQAAPNQSGNQTVTCVPADCQTQGGGCGLHATCSGSGASLTCACATGWTGDGHQCTDINECAIGSASCDPYATCTNTPGSYTCACNPGFMGDGMTCTSIDYCSMTPQPCGNGTCTDTPGSYSCACPSGYAFDGNTCVVDPCSAPGAATCATNGHCIAVQSGTSCTCNTGYYGDGTTSCHLGYASLAAGGSATCGIRTDGTLWCWGNLISQSTGGDQATPTQVDMKSDWVAASIGPTINLGLKKDGSLWSWSFQTDGMKITGVNAQALPVGQQTFKTFSVSQGEACFIASDGSLWCGSSGARSMSAPTQVGSDKDWATISSGAGYSCAIKTSGTLWCWGTNTTGNLGDGSMTTRSAPEQIGSALWRSVAAGQGHTCGVRQDDSLWCWGQNSRGELGTGSMSMTPVPVPTQVGTGTNWASVAVNGLDTTDGGWSCALKTDGSLWCWGANTLGEVGDGSNQDIAFPSQVGAGQSWSQLALGQAHACALQKDGSLWCWGDNKEGERGDGSDGSPQLTPVSVGTATWTAMDSHFNHTCAVKQDGTLWCWGLDTDGDLGDGQARSQSAPVQVGSSTAWKSVAAGSHHNCALQTDGTLWCWGDDSLEQLGSVMSAPATTPIPTIVGGSAVGYRQACAGLAHSCAIGTDGSLWCWGEDGSGQDGFTPPNAPTSFLAGVTQVGTGTNWQDLACGSYFTCAVKTDGTLWCWGTNAEGELGTSTSQNISTAPLQVGKDTHWASVAAGDVTACAVKTDGTLWCWGGNRSGQAGVGTTAASVMTPTQVGTGTTWAVPAVGGEPMAGEQSCATRTDGTLWCWGGLNIMNVTAWPSSPTQVGTDTNWKVPTAASAYGCGIQSDGTVWCWGQDVNGELGNASAWSTSPVQVVQW